MDTKFVVRSSDGSVDLVASATKYGEALAEWAALNEVPSETIEAAVEAVFDSHPSGLSMPALVHYAVTELKADPAQFKAMQDRVSAYIKGQCANNTGRLNVAKGKGGGATRLARPGEAIPARAEKPAKKSA